MVIIMIIYMARDKNHYSSILEKLRERSASYRVASLYGKTLIIAWPDSLAEGLSDPSVEAVYRVRKPYVLTSREWKTENTLVNVRGVEIGGKRVIIAAGPCSVEDEEQMIDIARRLKSLGVSILRGGAFKPRTSPYSFQGLGEKGLKILKRISDEVGIPVAARPAAKLTICCSDMPTLKYLSGNLSLKYEALVESPTSAVITTISLSISPRDASTLLIVSRIEDSSLNNFNTRLLDLCVFDLRNTLTSNSFCKDRCRHF